MAGKRKNHDTHEESTPSLVEGITTDVKNLIAEHFDLLRSEMKDELGKAKNAALSFGVGTGATALAGITGTMMVVHLLHDVTRLPLWMCYGIVCGTACAVGTSFLSAGVQQASEVSLLPQRTAAVLQEEFAGNKPEPVPTGA